MFGNESYKKQTCDMVKFWLKGKNNAQFEITALSVSTICSALPTKGEVTDFPHLANLEFAEKSESDGRETPTDILISLELCYQIVSAKRIGDTGPIAIGSIIGYLLCGPVKCSQSNRLLANPNLIITPQGDKTSFEEHSDNLRQTLNNFGKLKMYPQKGLTKLNQSPKAF